MEILANVKSLALYFRRFTDMQNAIIIACLAIVISILTRNMWVCVLYISGLYISFYGVKRLVGKTEYLHTEWTLKVKDAAKIALFLIKNLSLHTKKHDLTRAQSSTWEELVKYSVPHAEAQTMIQYISRDFIKTWYSSISTDEACPGPDELQEVIELGFNDVFRRIQTVDKYKFIQWCIEFYKLHLTCYQRASNTLRQQPKYKKKKCDSNVEFTKLKDINDAFESLGAFHFALKNKEAEKTYLLLALRMSLTVLLPEEANDCEATFEALSQIIACNLLVPLLNMMGDPYWLHKTIIRIVSNEELILVDPVAKAKLSQTAPHKTDANTSALADAIFHECKDPSNAASNQPVSTNETLPPDYYDAIIQAHPHIKKERTPSISSLDSSETESLSARPKFWVPNSDGADDTSDQDVCEVTPAKFERRFSPEGESLSQDGSVDSHGEPAISVEPFQSAHSAKPSLLLDPDAREGSISSADSAEHPPPYEAGIQPLFHHTADSDADADDDDDGDEDDDPHPPQRSVKHSATPLPSAVPASTATRSMSLDAADLRLKHLQSPKFIFVEITIVGTETAVEPTGNQYTLYKIEYTANHKDESANWSQKKSVVKRRYREFVTLQDRLEEHPLYKKSMKGVWGPQRWTALPLRNMSDSKVERRRKALTVYLQTLIAKEDVGNSMALREFLAYEGDASLAFVRKAPEMPRIDKVLKKTFFGVVDKISSALPSLPSADSTGSPRRRSRIKKMLRDVDFGKWEDPDSLDIDFGLLESDEVEDATSLENLFSRHKYSTLQSQGNFERESPESSEVYKEEENEDGSEEFYDVMEDRPPITIPRSQGDGCESKDFRKGSRYQEIPLAAAVLDLAIQLGEGRDAWVKHDKVIHVFKVVFGRALNRFLHCEIDDVTTEKRCTYCVYLLRETIWPDGEFDNEPTETPSERQKEVTRQQAFRCLKNFFPGFLPILVGPEVFDYAIEQIFNSLDHPKLNRHLVLCLLDHILQTLIPELNTVRLQEKLLKRNPDHVTVM